MAERVAPMADEDYAKGLRWSLIVHGSLIAAILIKSLVFPSKPFLYIPSLRVDIVGLPDVLKKDLRTGQISEILKGAEEEAKKVKAQPIIKEKEAPKADEMALKPKEASAVREKRMKSALERIKSLEKITGETHAVIKGNKVSKGTSLSGDAKETAEANYFDLIRDRLSDNWDLPVWLKRQNLSAQVQIFVDSRGKLHHMRLVKPSGNAKFDEEVKRTINQSQPFPAPPDNLAGSMLADGILVGFPL